MHVLTYKPLGVGEGHITWRGSVSLVVSDNFNFPVLKHAHTRVRRAKIYAYGCHVL